MWFKIRRFSVVYRLPLAIILIGLGIWSGIEISWGLGWLPIFIGLLAIVAYFMVGPISLVQHYVEDGDVEGAQKLINLVKYPKLLYKPVRSAYFMLKANFSTMNEDLDTAERDLKEGLKAGGTDDKEFQGTALLQLGSIALRKGNMKDAYGQLRQALQAGLPDADSNATAYLQLASICVQRRDYRGAKFYYGRARSAKPKNQQLIDQLEEMKKYISRIPG